MNLNDVPSILGESDLAKDARAPDLGNIGNTYFTVVVCLNPLPNSCARSTQK